MKLGFFSKLVRLSKRKRTPEELERLRVEFTERFESFKRLIVANRSALEKMAEIEECLSGNIPLSINFLRSRSASISENVLALITHLNQISANKYAVLYDRFNEIEEKIAPYIASDLRPMDAPYAVALSDLDITASAQVGEKMATLGEIYGGLGLTIPQGFVVTAKAYWHFFEHSGAIEKIYKLLRTADLSQIDRVYEISAGIKQVITEAELPAEISEAITRQYELLKSRMGGDLPMAVRSSAQGEDLPGKSCAGMYRTLLGVRGDSLVDAYKEVVASKYTTRAIMYRLKYGIGDEDVAMCVGCMPLINARCGGVAYSRNPLDIEDRRVMIHSVFGLPGPVADGSATADLISVSRDKPLRVVESEIAGKTHRQAFDNDTVSTVPLTEEERKSASIDEERALELAKQVLMIEEYFGSPQDVEWALAEDGSIVLLQSRVLVQRKRIQTGSEAPEADGEALGEVVATGEVTASQGAAAGPVHIVKQEVDMLRFPEGGVLVASQPLPNWAVTLKSVSAVVTEQGGVAGHLANIARELHIPALFGVKNATKILESGRVVTVDADSKRIYDGRVESLLVEHPRPQVHWNEDSPVYEALANMAKHIVPLHLLDPDDKENFSPETCTTLHDITRFCHEKSVREMFRFGKEHRFPERSAKRLFAGVPTQFWVIDLKDGFKPGLANSEDIMLEDIVSIPMQALWYGMMTIPWEGPPVDARGFLEVLMESTANPGLNPSMPSPYAERNYFMLTRKYCSCQTRFGYHFSTVEALVGERRHENYLSFNFRGGAANQTRRQRRARLVADVLQEHDLRVHLVKDSVHAELEKYDERFMEQRLKVVGYLMFHTRQLDMVLGDDATAASYKEKIDADLKSLLG